MDMRKCLAVFTGFLLFTGFFYSSQISFATYVSIENDPYIIKNQLLIESAKITGIGMQAAKDTLKLAFYENITEAEVARTAAQAMVDSGSSEYIEAFGVMVASAGKG